MSQTKSSGMNCQNSQVYSFWDLYGTQDKGLSTVKASLWNSLERNLKLSKSLNVCKQRLQGKLSSKFLSS